MAIMTGRVNEMTEGTMKFASEYVRRVRILERENGPLRAEHYDHEAYIAWGRTLDANLGALPEPRSAYRAGMADLTGNGRNFSGITLDGGRIDTSCYARRSLAADIAARLDHSTSTERLAA